MKNRKNKISKIFLSPMKSRNNSIRNYKALLKTSFSSIISAYKNVLHDSNTGLTVIYDNFHILNAAFDECKCSPFINVKPYPFIFGKIYNFLSECSFSTSEESFLKFLISLRQEHYLTYKELFDVSSAISGACIYEAGRLCSKRQNSHEENETKNLISLIKLLRDKENWDFEKILSSVSETEKTFIEFEPSFNLMDDLTKNRYRETFSAFCESQKLNEKNASELLKQYCIENQITIGEIIFKEEKLPSVLFTLSSAVITVIMTIISVYCIGSIGAFLALPSLITTAMCVADILMSASEKTRPCPRLELDNIPIEAKTAVVISTLLINEKENKEICKNLERFYLLNREDNICFTVLGDFPEGNESFPNEKEKAVMENLFLGISALNREYGDKFTVFVRNRKYYEDEQTYYGKERKRGAISDLVDFILEKKAFDYSYGNTEKLFGTKYLFLLDGDTGIGFSTVLKMVSCAIHPLNKPVIQNGKVVKGYGVFQPAVKFSLVHQNHTFFQSFISGTGGVDNYESASYDRYQSVFESGIFCGKGLLNVELYKQMVMPQIPSNAVLSHDMPEGNLLRCRLVSDITTTDDSPSNAISYFSRLHRWIRGDIQNLIFLRNKNMSDFSFFKILGNVQRHITPIFSLLLLTFLAFTKGKNETWGLFFSLLYILFPFISVLLFAPFRAYNKSTAFGRRFYSQVTDVYLSNVMRVIYELSLVPHYAYVGANAILKSLYRMFFSKRRLLEWKTFGQSELSSTSSLSGYYMRFFPNLFFGIILLFCKNILFFIIGLLFISAPFVLFLMSRERKQENPISEEEKAKLSEYSKKIWNFFEENVDESTNFLPPDNIQTAPTDAIAMRTSPTNIGFYLLSCLAALDFGFITISQFQRRINDTISIIEKLKKYKGHLYNWYDLKNLELLGGGFVSTVDSGNFVTMLLCLKEGLLEYGLEEEAKRVGEIMDKTDFLCLYNKRKKLFTIGINGDTGKMEENCYDLFMSEARTTSYFAVAKRIVSQNHWKALGRTLIGKNGFLGMASWSGTMFEYFMPVLFLPIYKNSFSYEALAFAFNQQRKNHISKLWGMSESGFYSFDSELNYQYKAHGIPSLSLKRYPESQKVLSPYSSFLTICINRKASLLNLERFSEQGLYGKYGFYEAVDFTNGKAIVKSYMSHHMGMSIVASANACFDNIFVNRFMRQKEMNAASDLLKERIPTNAPLYNNPSSETEDAKLSARFFEGITSKPSFESPQTALLSSGNLDIRITDGGIVQLLYRGIPINEGEFTIGEINHSLAVGFIDADKNINYVSALLADEPDSCSFESGKNFSSHIISGRDFAASVNYSISESGDCFIIETKGNIKRKFSPFIIFEPQMTENSKYYSGKSFSMMKVRCEYHKESESFFISCKDSPFTVCIQCDNKIDKYLTTRDMLPPYKLFEETNVCESFSPSNSVYPLCYLKALPVSGGCCKFYIGTGKTKEQSKRACEKEKKKKTLFFRETMPADPLILSQMTSSVIFPCIKEKNMPFSNIRQELWKKGISGDYPIYALYVKDILTEELMEYISAYVYSYRAHLKYELFIFFDEDDLYFRKTEHKLLSIIYKAGGGSLKGKSPGIHLLDTFFSKELFDEKKSYADFRIVSNRFNSPLEKSFFFPSKPQKHKWEKSEDFIRIDEKGFIFHKNSILKRKPYSYILAGEKFGSLVTDSSLGFTFSENSRLMKLSHYDESPTANEGEKVFAFFENKYYDLCLFSNTFRCKNGVAIYEGEFENIKFSLCVFVSVSKREKYIIVSFSREGISAVYSFRPVMGESFMRTGVIQTKKKEDKKDTTILFHDSYNTSKQKYYGFCSSFGTEVTKPFNMARGSKINVYATGQRLLFRIGERKEEDFPLQITIEEALSEKVLQEEFSKSFVPHMSFKTENDGFEKIFPFLFYQTASSRFYTKTGFYQNGGAFGFRDQLQDCLSLVYSIPKEVRKHILKAAHHQYKEGDVMHWWHELGGEHFGVRTKCSDDFLWLPFVVAKYIKLTGDRAILFEKIPFLSSPPLDEVSNERYEKATFTLESESLYYHCILSLSHGFESLKDGISLMGSCDWNDGFSEIGNKGLGKSLFTSRLLVICSKAFSTLMKEKISYEMNQNFEILDTKEKLLKKALELENVIEEKYFINGQYARCVSDDGTIFGIGETKACATDILCQAFAVFGEKNKERAKAALLEAYSTLYEKESGTLRLFAPPFDDKTERGGYINDYPSFVRENSGQYTHAAVWTAIALLKCGEIHSGLELLNNINPFERCKNEISAEIYKNEPYVLSADIYSGTFKGRGGWSWYTGAASWYSVAIIEHVLGLNFNGFTNINGEDKYLGSFKCLDIKPIIPYTATISFGDYTLNVKVKKGIPSVTLDGEKVTFPIIIPPKESTLEVSFE